MLVIYSFIFLLLKYVYSLLDVPWINDNKEFYQAMGFATDYITPETWS